ncbi:pyridoxal phosphate-dependent decarboxylase family protein [Microscilla marina]|uniref:Pyridoxal-dependent decarboxylase conserved domain, putative n=1 Tax=Microscilla marina ATCC 23134 TaxID=313606 RepID=A1ZD82_MICM2|nr:pyridoxal-dependent decarboxylase [Microscilla marina]EAY31621.1 pyridoxal-dependent decarboxylase conserved domain, putative [Microscilla marina ATCC 23134]
MYTLLAQDQANFRQLLDQAHTHNQDFIAHIDQIAPFIPVENLPYQPLETQGVGAQHTLTEFTQRFGHYVQASGNGRFFGFVLGGSTPAALMGDLLTSTFDQSNSNIQDLVEQEAINNLRELFMIPTTFEGNFVTGATMANFSGLATARQWVGKQKGKAVDQTGLGELGNIKILGAVPHSSIFKSLSMLGIGKQNVIKVPTLPQREAIDVALLETTLAKLSQQYPGEAFIVVASAGTVNTGDFDDLVAIGALKNKYSFWLHIDAAFGGFVACSPQYAHYWQGIAHADSITIDAHKWLNVPYDAAVIFTQHQALQHEVFLNKAAYLAPQEDHYEFINLTPENSRRWRGLPVWFTLKAYGKEGYREIMERNCQLAQQLGQYITQDNRFELLAVTRLNIVCFTLRLPNHQVVNKELIQLFLHKLATSQEVFMSPTFYKGSFAIRAAFANWRTQQKDLERTWQLLQKTYEDLLKASLEQPTNI